MNGEPVKSRVRISMKYTAISKYKILFHSYQNKKQKELTNTTENFIIIINISLSNSKIFSEKNTLKNQIKML